MSGTSISSRFDGLEGREKILISLMVLAVVYMAVEFLLLKPAADQQKSLLSQLETVRNSSAGEQEQLAQLQNSLAGGSGNASVHIQALQQQLDSLQEELATLAGGLVDANRLPQILEDVLLQTGKLSLLKLQAQPAEELQLSATDDDGKPLSAGVYRHAVSLQLRGSYFDVVEYLQALEQLPWGLRWQNLNYRAASYPNADVTLRVYTLTAEEGLFGNE